ncbi:ATP-binding protein [Pollutibacter soli]|uniref:ATP-binding protein n=1 Tax=Pollutibacter soli TaxID=3034157 RepID=UPI0030140734
MKFSAAQTDSSAREFPFYFQSGFTRHFQLNTNRLADSINRMKVKLQQLDPADTARFRLTIGIAIPYIEINNDSSLKYALLAKKEAQRFKMPAFEGQANDFLGAVYIRLGNSTLALQHLIEARNYFQKVNRKASQMIVIGRNLGDLYAKEGDTLLAKENYFNALSIEPKISSEFQFRSWVLTGLGEIYLHSGQLDSALYYTNESIAISDRNELIILRKYTAQALHNLGLIKLKKGDTVAAFNIMQRGLEAAYRHNNYQITGEIFLSIAEIYAARHISDSAFTFYQAAYEVASEMRISDLLGKSSLRLKEYYKAKGNIDSALYYAEKVLGASVLSRDIEKAKQTQTLTFKESLKEQQRRNEVARSRARTIYISLATILAVVLISGIFLYRSYKKQRAANLTLQKQKQEIQETLELLRSTQKQLIQAEKMASLGELTTGIAHEIQNPLNFINNFSEVNRELISDLNIEIEKGNYDEVKIIAADISENEMKINHHGKRADTIVKGMLQHSRKSEGTKEPTDINALCDEYIRLASHGLLAKDKTFNTTIKTDFDPAAGKINIIPQDIGRVLLNLFNNAFYAVKEKQKENEEHSEEKDKLVKVYEPTVSVRTRKDADKIKVTVSDNGNGIPGKVIDKIFQPFFTTKPTGQGTGLGLSLAYDIVKAHGGDLLVETTPGMGSSFIIELPVQKND